MCSRLPANSMKGKICRGAFAGPGRPPFPFHPGQVMHFKVVRQVPEKSNRRRTAHADAPQRGTTATVGASLSRAATSDARSRRAPTWSAPAQCCTVRGKCSGGATARNAAATHGLAPAARPAAAAADNLRPSARHCHQPALLGRLHVFCLQLGTVRLQHHALRMVPHHRLGYPVTLVLPLCRIPTCSRRILFRRRIRQPHPPAWMLQLQQLQLRRQQQRRQRNRRPGRRRRVPGLHTRATRARWAALSSIVP